MARHALGARASRGTAPTMHPAFQTRPTLHRGSPGHGQWTAMDRTELRVRATLPMAAAARNRAMRRRTAERWTRVLMVLALIMVSYDVSLLRGLGHA
ncbi:MAG: hypothetical protein QOJ60_876 [Actinomycetota bacterium]|nr:hypothetical protein [Actinomycetota bacterium]